MKSNPSSRILITLMTLGIMSLAMTACNDDVDDWQSMEGRVVKHNLINFNTQGDFVAYAKDAAIQQMRAEVEVNRGYDKAWLNSDFRYANVEIEAMAMDDASGDGGSQSAAPEYSETNTQEEGVDEADVVKTDGNYIYTLHKGELIIVSAIDGMMEKVSSLEVGGYTNELFIYGNVAVVFSRRAESEVPVEIHYAQKDYVYPSDGDKDLGMVEPDVDIAIDPVYCDMYGCGERSYAQMTVIDMTDRAAPSILKTTIYAADYVTSRMVGGKVRMVLDSPIDVLGTEWDYGSNANFETLQGINDAYRNVIEVNEKLINALTAEQIVPKKWDSVTEAVSYVIDPNRITGPETPNGVGLQTVVSVDLQAPLADSMQAGVFSQRGIVYASRESLYLTSARDWVSLAMESGLWSGYENQTTGIHKFNISSETADVTYQATGQVDGRLLDQFCMGEHNGYLRVATTTGDFWWDDEEQNTLDNHVFVLQQQGATLVQTGHLGGLGEGEKIYAARFMGDRGFLVTYLQIDPLYTLDLSDPTNPISVGEWEGPGYSTYLHPWGDNLILSVGEEDWRAAISLYNISDFSNPDLVQRFYLGEQEWSSALYEHKAVTFNKDSGYLAIPYSNWGASYDTGIRTFTISEAGIAPGDRLSFFETTPEGVEAEAQRSMYIGDYMYGASRCRLSSAAIAAPSVPVDSVALFDGDICEDQYYYYY